MDTKEIVAVLAQTELFSGLTQEQIGSISANCSEKALAEGDVLVRQGERGNEMFILIEGLLGVYVDRGEGKEAHVASIHEMKCVGEMQMMLGGQRTATVRASAPCRLLRLSRSSLEVAAKSAPAVITVLTDIVRKRQRRSQLTEAMTKLIGSVDTATIDRLESLVEWIHLDRDDVLFQQGDPGDSWYTIVSGRLAIVVKTPKGSEEVVSVLRSGESLGEISLFLDSPRTATVVALRDTALIRIGKDAFARLCKEFPAVNESIIRLLATRLVQRTAPAHGPAEKLVLGLVPAESGDWVQPFADQLAQALSLLGPTAHLTRAAYERDLGHALPDDLPADHISLSRFAAWVEEAEATHQYVLLQSDLKMAGWMSRIPNHADRCIYVARAAQTPTLDAFAAHAQRQRIGAAHWQLILIHPPSTVLPTGTSAWLGAAPFQMHTHVRDNDTKHMERAARVMTDRAVGVVLGGGGARGFAHIGVLKAMKELGIPVDMICGTSMGSIMAGQYAMGHDFDEIIKINRAMIKVDPFTEYTIPIIALLASKKIDQVARASFGDTMIEDLWINYFCISSNLTTSHQMVHDRSHLWVATRASGSLPGIAVPVLMNGHLLVDGGIINNVPGDVMRERCKGVVFAVNVSPEDDVAVHVVEMPTSWQVFWSRVLPWKKAIKVPGIADILMRTTMLASASRLKSVRDQVTLFMEPPIHKWGMLEFEAIDALIATGYEHAKKELSAWREAKDAAAAS